MTSRERVIRALRFEQPDRAPRDLWVPDDAGGGIAQCEWGRNGAVENVPAVYGAWEEPLPRAPAT